MPLTPSTMLALGTPMPEFSLAATDGTTVSSGDLLGGKAALVIFIANHCPFVQHIRGGLAQFAKDYETSDLNMVAINSNDIDTHPADSPERMKEEVEQQGYVFPYLFDVDQSVAKSYQAACTPDIFLFDADGRLVYRGQFDGARPRNEVPVTGRDLRSAVDAVLSGQQVGTDQIPSAGCNIKWRPGNEPSYVAN